MPGHKCYLLKYTTSKGSICVFEMVLCVEEYCNRVLSSDILIRNIFENSNYSILN